MNLKKIIFIAGPTAVGKTAAAVGLAKKIKGEIISCDSMQVYKEISILSNKPPMDILKEVPHHLISVVSVTKNFDAATFRKSALATIKKIHQKNKIPVIVGGSGLYMAVLLDGIFQGVRANPRLRKKLEKEAAEKGNEFLYQKLERIDSQAAIKIHPHDTRRIIRALEVFLLTQKPISRLQEKREGLWGKFDIKIFALTRERSELYDMINRRIDRMFQEGAVEEVKGLTKKKWSKTAEGIIGAREIKGFLCGEYDLERAKYLIKRNTRHYAKRQWTWFRRDKRLRWIIIGKDDSAQKTVSKIMKGIKSNG